MRFLRFIRSIGLTVQSARGWFAAVTVFAPCLAATIGGVLNGIPWYWLIVLVGAALTTCSGLSYVSFRLYDYVVAKIGIAKYNNGIADRLQKVRNAGNEVLWAAEIVDLWEPADKWRQNVALRKLQRAVDQRQVRTDLDAELHMDDVIALFRSGDIDRLRR
jgi:hypothetical protein